MLTQHDLPNSIKGNSKCLHLHMPLTHHMYSKWSESSCSCGCRDRNSQQCTADSVEPNLRVARRQQLHLHYSCSVVVVKQKQAHVSNIIILFYYFFQIIAFDELRTDFKNPIDQSNPTRAVRTLLFHFLQEWSNLHVHTEKSLLCTFKETIYLRFCPPNIAYAAYFPSTVHKVSRSFHK